MQARLTGRREVAEGTAAFTFEVEGPLAFEAGQTCDFTLTAPKYTDDRGNARTFSIASSPADLPAITIATRLTGSAFKRSLLECPLGTPVELDGPYGSFTLHHNASRPALMLAGGIGITPFRSIVKHATERRLPHRIVVLYSNRTRAATAFLDDLTAWAARNPNLTVVPAYTDETGFIDAAFIARHSPEAAAAIAYAAGPAPFVAAMRAAALEAGVDPDQIRTEEFPGY